MVNARLEPRLGALAKRCSTDKRPSRALHPAAVEAYRKLGLLK
jgi:hypothetical protein